MSSSASRTLDRFWFLSETLGRDTYWVPSAKSAESRQLLGTINRTQLFFEVTAPSSVWVGTGHDEVKTESPRKHLLFFN